MNRLGLRRLVGRLAPWLALPDEQVGWVPFARRRARRVLAGQAHDAIVTTAAPYSAHLVGLGLRRTAGLPWIADFRDEWTTNPYLRERYPTDWHRRWNRALERRVLETADAVVSVSKPWLEAIHGVAPHLDGRKFHVLPNGYDADHHPAEPAAPPDRFRIVYTGTFYGHRSPGPFLEALNRVVVDGRLPPEDLEVVLMGHGGTDRPPVPLAPPVAGCVRTVGHRPHREALELVRRAAVLLLVVPPEGGAGNHTGKLFNYLASGRPILCLAPEPNVAADLVRESASGVVAPPEDPAKIGEALLRLHAAWKRRVPLEVQRREVVVGYEAGRQAEAWARLLDAVAGRAR
jgi:glycosyltransferase involved in cell wall biosynthesis